MFWLTQQKLQSYNKQIFATNRRVLSLLKCFVHKVRQTIFKHYDYTVNAMIFTCGYCLATRLFAQYFMSHFLNDNVAQAKFCVCWDLAWQAGQASREVEHVPNLPLEHYESPGTYIMTLLPYSTRVWWLFKISGWVRSIMFFCCLSVHVWSFFARHRCN